MRLKLFFTVLALWSIFLSFGQQMISVHGVVYDENGVPVPGVNIVIVNSTKGTSTDFDGIYAIDVESGQQLKFSSIGFQDQVITVSDQNQIDVTLEEGSALDEVVVVGYGEQSKRNVTGAISSVDLSNSQNVTDLGETLNGVSGVQFKQSGRPGETGDILIRGQNSLESDVTPLIVLDGIIFFGTLNDINPDDIESMEILKDASSTAIYGSRAANGVILITSKRGTTEKPKLSVNFFQEFSSANSKKLNNMDVDKYLDYQLDYRRAIGVDVDPNDFSSYLSSTEVDNLEKGRGGNTWDAIKQSSHTTSLSVNYSGKTKYSSYFVSASHTNAKGLVINDNLKRTTARVNLNTKVFDWLTFGVNSTFIRRDMSGRDVSLREAYRISPLGTYFHEDGSPTQFTVPDEQAAENPLWRPLLTDNSNFENNLFANFYVELDVPYIDGLSYRLNYSPNFIWKHDYSFFNKDSHVSFNNSEASKFDQNDTNWFVENIITYKKRFNDIHKIDLTLLYSRDHKKFSNTTSEAFRFTPDVLGYDNLSLGNSPKVNSMAEKVDGNSYMARINYGLMDRYLLTFTVRRDASSVFAENHKKATFPSASLGWIASEENFLNGSNVIDLLKFRLSYGKVGNQGIDPYQSLGLSRSEKYVFDDGGSPTTTIIPDVLGNPDLKWETTKSLNFGIDYQLFNNKLGGSIEFYDDRTEDLIVRRTIPVMNGFKSILTNIGEVQNTGIEFSLNSTNINSSNFKWTSNFSFSYNKNEIRSLGDGVTSDISNNWFVGQPIKSFYDYLFAGIYQEGDTDIPSGSKPGFVRVKDLNGDGEITPADRKVVASGGDPKYQFYLQNKISYKNLSLNVMLNAMAGWKAPFDLINPLAPGRGINDFNTDWWTPDNPVNNRPSLDYTNPLGTHWYISRDFLRLQEITLSYNLQKDFLKDIGVSGLEFYITGKNLKTWTDWLGPDPENAADGYTDSQGPAGSGDWYPIPKSLMLGFNLKF